MYLFSESSILMKIMTNLEFRQNYNCKFAKDFILLFSNLQVNEPECEDDYFCDTDYLWNDPDCNEADTWDKCPKSCGEC